MGGEIKWEGLAVLAEMLGITDIERLIIQLAAIREHIARQNRVQAEANR